MVGREGGGRTSGTLTWRSGKRERGILQQIERNSEETGCHGVVELHGGLRQKESDSPGAAPHLQLRFKFYSSLPKVF